MDYGSRIISGTEWIEEITSRAVSTHTLHYAVAVNDLYDAREGKIVFYNLADKSMADTVSIRQMQMDAIVLSESHYTIEAAGGSLDFTVNANVDFNVSTSAE